MPTDLSGAKGLASRVGAIRWTTVTALILLVNGKAAYRRRRGYTSAACPDPGRPKDLYVREDQIVPRLAALAVLHARDDHATRGRTKDRTPRSRHPLKPRP